MTTRGIGPGGSRPPGPAGTPSPRSGRGSKMLGSRAVLVSSASTVLFFAVIAVIVVLSPGSEIVAERFFSPRHLWQSLIGSGSNPSVLGAFWLNVKIFMVSEVFILILALVIAVVRGIPGPVFFPFRLVAVAYTDLLRRGVVPRRYRMAPREPDPARPFSGADGVATPTVRGFAAGVRGRHPAAPQ